MSPALALRRAAAWLLRAGAGAPRAGALPGLGGARAPVLGEAGRFLGIWGGPAAGGGGGAGSWWFRCAVSSVPRPGLLVEQLLVGGVRSFATGAAPEHVSFSAAVREEGDSQSEKPAVTSDKNMLGDRSLKLLSGSCYLPHPDKEDTGGEDAHFIWDEQAIGLADGVGGWASYGIDAGQYARDIMSHAVTAIEQEPKDSIDLSRVLEKAHRNTTVKGSSTACIVALTDQGIQAISLGDSGFILIRDGCTLFRSPIQQHDFNFTYQLESGNSSDLPSAAQVFMVPAASGDVLVAGTDGLFDNLYNNEITAVVVHATRAGLEPQVTAQKIAALARQRAQDKGRQTPFSSAAQEAGYRYYGGKLDDITVVVSYITAFGTSQPTD
ncbi:probable protein phosphatase 2C 55 [Brachypodium distachyon]|uniref:Protein phosphatase n=1 Tax=Brachypodium distachyon TaxID=15368 RepID=I1HX26_BRADI|nr:probable protein phosphatase 2C 55 [Brachypodium distachyon]KQJ93256.1 hypothetical protein BRADI_3g03480v3 [Brachypodium distachyon]|eukprot:XP_003574421.1 probable protein phosphatase 2C 55 [Brachypodium distachyon]